MNPLSPGLPPSLLDRPSLQQETSSSSSSSGSGGGDGAGRKGSNSSHVRSIIREQFASEVSYKEEELEKIEDRIHLAKMMLQRLRLGVLAQHYGVAAFYPTALDYREETIGEQHNWETFEEELVARQDPTNAESAPAESEAPEAVEEEVRENHDVGVDNREDLPADERKPDKCKPPAESANSVDKKTNFALDLEDEDPHVTMETSPAPATPLADHSGSEDESDDDYCDSRFYYKKRIIIGNTSQFLDPTAHHVTGDGSTHKWMVYVRGPQMEPDISHFVKAVRFFLHPSYHPNDIVRVRSPPFHLTRLGWGEFPVRVQLEFVDKANKNVDVIHNLVLDRTHTGEQTLGAETVVDLDIVAPPKGEGFRLNGLSSRCTTVKGSALENGHHHAPIPDRDHTLSSPPPMEGVASTALQAPPLPLLSPRENEDSAGSATPIPPRDHTPSSPPPFGSPGGSSGAGGTVVLTTNLDKCLHNAVRAIPIYGKPNLAEEFYIPAPSLAQFRLWNIGRRRATEWERAVAIRKSIENKLKVPSLLSTKQVMQWCRQNGYTPLDPVPTSGRGFCKVCGCLLEAGTEEGEEEWGEEMDGGEDGTGRLGGVARRYCPEVHEHCQVMMFGRQGLPLRGTAMDPFEELRPDSVGVVAAEDETLAPLPKLCSLSEPHKLVSKLFTHQASLEERARRSEEEVDVSVLPLSPSCARSRALVDMVPRFRVPQTPELKWVQQSAASIGLHIYPAVIDRMYAHVVEHMIYISCTRFLRGILGQAVQGAGQMLEGKLSQDRVLTPFHVQQALLKLEHCDFLTNRCLGVQPSLGGGGGGGGAGRDDNGSSSSSDASSESDTSDQEGL